MKHPSTLASLLVVAVLSVAGLTAVTSAYGGSDHKGHGAWADHGKKKMCDRHGRGGKHGKHWKHGQKRLVEKLNIMETKIGIRANQLDAWRDFTDALLATMAPPWAGMKPGKMTPDQDAAPFSLAERFADRAIDRAKSAEDLKAAIEQLRTTLTPEQLEKVQKIEAKLRARMMRHHGKGHHGKGPHGKGPHSGPPAASDDGPDAGPADTPDDDDGDEDTDDTE